MLSHIRYSNLALSWALLFLMISGVAAMGADEGIKIEGPVKDAEKGIEVYQVSSPYTGGKNIVQVLLPDRIEKDKKYPVLYVLPVGGDFGGKYGDQLQEVRKADTQNKYGIIAMSMAFDTVPWYGANATDMKKRHEEYILKVIIPMIEKRYPVSAKKEDRYLFGFSKSGWGSVLLLLRNLDVFGAACSWDAPLMFTEKDFGKVGTKPHYGTAEQMAKYLPVKLAEEHAAELKGKPARLTILGRDIWWNHSSQFSKHLKSLSIPHTFDDSLKFKHEWQSGWVPKALDIFLPQYIKVADNKEDGDNKGE
ncbi:MAG: hypothetical protein JXR97_01645 [Planctomycetes bacterium]|nr:hypothetical protein [Planctomycetota bacterium]